MNLNTLLKHKKINLQITQLTSKKITNQIKKSQWKVLACNKLQKKLTSTSPISANKPMNNPTITISSMSILNLNTKYMFIQSTIYHLPIKQFNLKIIRNNLISKRYKTKAVEKIQKRNKFKFNNLFLKETMLKDKPKYKSSSNTTVINQ